MVNNLSTWWTYRSDYNGILTMTVTNDALPFFERFQIAVFTGSDHSDLKWVNSQNHRLPMNISIRAGEVYHLMVGSGEPPGHDYRMSLVVQGPSQLSGRLEPNGHLVLQNVGPGSGILETSTNLVDWLPLDQSSSERAWTIPTDAIASRFYRLRVINP